MWSSENRTKVCEWMGYAIGDLRTSSGYGEVWIGVLVWCYMECNSIRNSETDQRGKVRIENRKSDRNETRLETKMG